MAVNRDADRRVELRILQASSFYVRSDNVRALNECPLRQVDSGFLVEGWITEGLTVAGLLWKSGSAMVAYWLQRQ